MDTIMRRGSIGFKFRISGSSIESSREHIAKRRISNLPELKRKTSELVPTTRPLSEPRTSNRQILETKSTRRAFLPAHLEQILLSRSKQQFE